MSAREQTAEPAVNTGKSADIITTATLGRPFQLGMLYDCRNDALIPAVTLWDHDNLQNNKSVQQQHNTEFNVTTSDSIEEKSHSLQLSGALKLSLLGGLVDVGGSAKYFQDTKKSLKQARVTLQYRTTTKCESLTMSHLARGKMSHPNVFEDDIATHVVTAILYGAGAYFVFDRESSSEDDRKQIEGKAKHTFNKLKYVTVDAEASLNMDDEEKAAAEKFSCTFHGDFQLKTNPTSFSDAVSLYKNLPGMMGENGENAVPLRVWLYPLVKLDSRAAKLQRDISNSLITCSSETIESLTMTEMICSDILKDTTAATFPSMKKKVQTLMQRCCQYKLDFMQKLGSVLPSIRGGVKEESALQDILKAHTQSPFNSNELDQWLTRKQNELDALKSFLKQLEKLGAKMDDNMDDLLSDLDVKTIVCFSFTSVDQPDSVLVKLSDYLKPPGMVATSAESDLQARNTEWLSDDARLTMRRQLHLFGELKKLNNRDETKFIAASKYDESHPGAWIFIYEGGSSVAVPFVPPSKPANPTITGVTHDRLTVKVSEPDSATVDYRVEYRKKQEQETEWASHPVQKNQEAVTLSRLKPKTEYEIRATAVGKFGYAVSSAVTLTETRLHGHSQDLLVSSINMTSISSISSKYKDIISKSDLISTGSLQVYQMTPKKKTFGTLTRMTFGEKNEGTINKTIFFVGETGAGKSTLINALVNYAMGVKWEDNLWFEIVKDEKRQSESQTESQTSDVIVYEIFGYEDKTLPFSLTLIDTPGFGDTRGIEQDAIISQRLCDLLQSEEGVHEADAVALVLKASENRLSDRILYVFNSLMSLFGKDMEEKIIALITFASGGKPNDALKALEVAQIKCAKNDKNEPLYFLFNNCQKKDRTEDEDELERACGQTEKGMREFTTFLGKSTSQKLGKTREVLNKRIGLTACIQNLKERITLSEQKQTEITQIKEALENKVITAMVDEPYKEKETLVPAGWGWSILGWGWIFHNGATRCPVCEENCHYPGCTMAKSVEGCQVMAKSGCTSCTNKCPVSVHVKDNQIYVNKTRKVMKTNEELKRKYENKLSLDKEMEYLTAERLKLLEEAYQHVVKLDQIALNVLSLSTHVHLDFLIEKMKQTGDTKGTRSREQQKKIQKLEEMKSREDKGYLAALRYLKVN